MEAQPGAWVVGGHVCETLNTLCHPYAILLAQVAAGRKHSLGVGAGGHV